MVTKKKKTTSEREKRTRTSEKIIVDKVIKKLSKMGRRG